MSDKQPKSREIIPDFSPKLHKILLDFSPKIKEHMSESLEGIIHLCGEKFRSIWTGLA
jgi:hypothetical protein